MIRPAVESDHSAILLLNEESVQFTSPLDAAQLRRLATQADYHRVVEWDEEVAAFLLALREGADYESLNYRWFSDRLDRFLYVDRVVVAASQQGRGHGAHLYQDLFAYAAQQDVACIACV